MSRRSFLTASLCGAAGLALYSGEIARHWVEVTEIDISIAGLPMAFDGVRVAQLSDIHLDDFTEPFFLRHVVNKVNGLKPDMIFLTGDYVSDGVTSQAFARRAAWQCAEILRELKCRPLYAVLGNHDEAVGAEEVMAALRGNEITVLRNSYLPIERNGGRFWLAGLDDPVWGKPDPEKTVPGSICNIPNEPVVLLCHAPDYADVLLEHPLSQSIGLMLSGHTHGGQVRLPIVGALDLPGMGRKYVEGLFHLRTMQLYVNRGIGTIGVPFRLNCPPEITMITLRRAARKDISSATS
jgi:predicted MPP superfamily phosphohydrolase